MARPQGTGLDYFPLDVDADQDDKFQLLESKHGPLAFAVIVKLLMKIYKAGYAYQWGEAEQYLLAKRVGCDKDLVVKVAETALEVGVFDAETYSQTGFLTSKGIQKRFLEATKKRKLTLIDPLLVVKVELTPQSKVKESKEKERKVISKADALPVPDPIEILISKIEIPPSISKPDLIEWLRYKKEKGQSYKPTGLKALLKTWAKKPEAFARAVQHSMENNYQGLFEPKGDPARSNPKQSIQDQNFALYERICAESALGEEA